jgi:outer membrane receptor protein involved in Fe transport
MAKVKVGGVAEKKTTGYWEAYFNVPITPYNAVKDSIFQLPIERVYAPENFGPGRLQLVPIADPDHNKNIYDGDSELLAFYLMSDVPFTLLENRFRFAGGARVENMVQNINSPGARPEDRRNQLKNIDVLPSLNLTYMVGDIGNIRLAYSHSVNRPEFRERSLVIFEDILTKVLYGGNRDLQRAYIRNYDVRVEFFPGIGELLAASYFRKDFSGAIEEYMVGGSNRNVIFVNSPAAFSLGWELEARKSLDFLGSYMANLSINLNYTRIQSRVEYTYDATGGTGSEGTHTVIATRPLYGQSPYMINASLFFREPTWGTSLNVAYNVFGRRLLRVGGFIEPDTYEEPRDLVDISLSQPVFHWLEAKLTIKNLNGKDRILSRDGMVYERVSSGTTYGLQLSMSM